MRVGSRLTYAFLAVLPLAHLVRCAAAIPLPFGVPSPAPLPLLPTPSLGHSREGHMCRLAEQRLHGVPPSRAAEQGDTHRDAQHDHR